VQHLVIPFFITAKSSWVKFIWEALLMARGKRTLATDGVMGGWVVGWFGRFGGWFGGWLSWPHADLAPRLAIKAASKMACECGSGSLPLLNNFNPNKKWCEFLIRHKTATSISNPQGNQRRLFAISLVARMDGWMYPLGWDGRVWM